MKFLIAVSCVIAVASAGLITPYGVVLQNQPILNIDGTPLEPLPNVIARQNHAVAHLNAQLRNGDVTPIHSIYASPLITSSGVPLELPANQIARAQHAAAHVDAAIRNGDAVLLARKRRSLVYAVPQHIPLIDQSGVPVEPLENQVARIQHANAHVHAQLRNGDALALQYPIAPIIGHSLIASGSVPAELPANQIARAQHAAAHLEANLRSGNAVLLARKRRSLVYAVPQHLPLIDQSGVPVEPLANQIARAQHATAHLDAQLRNGDVALASAVPIVSPSIVPTTYAAYAAAPVVSHVSLVQPLAEITHNGAHPVDTAEVAAAKAEHLIAKGAILVH